MRLQTPQRSSNWRPTATETLQKKQQNQFPATTLTTEGDKVFPAMFIPKHPLTTDGGRNCAQFARTDPGGGQWPSLNTFIFLLSDVYVIGDRCVNKLSKAFNQRWKDIFPENG